MKIADIKVANMSSVKRVTKTNKRDPSKATTHKAIKKIHKPAKKRIDKKSK